MNMQNTRRLQLIGIVICAIVLLGLTYQPSAVASTPHTLALVAPALAGMSGQAAVDNTIAQRLDAEAGISAYFKSPDPITLSQVRPMFRTIETETPDYILGSIGIPNYPEEHFDAHVYIHRTGWILAYYLRDALISKIIDGRAQTINTTKLNNVVAAVASTAGAPFTSATHYDFRYPSATNMLLVAEHHSNGDSFTIRLPASYGYFERGWALSSDYYFRLNGVERQAQFNVNYMKYGTISASELMPDTTHTIQVYPYGVLIIMYRVP